MRWTKKGTSPTESKGSDYEHRHCRELGDLPKEVLRKVVRENVIGLYNLKIDGVN